jgi:hypothetical protein
MMDGKLQKKEPKVKKIINFLGLHNVSTNHQMEIEQQYHNKTSLLRKLFNQVEESMNLQKDNQKNFK